MPAAAFFVPGGWCFGMGFLVPSAADSPRRAAKPPRIAAILVIQAQNWRGQGPTGSPQPPIRHEWPLNHPGQRPSSSYRRRIGEAKARREAPPPPIHHEWPLNHPGSRPGPAHSPRMAAKPPRIAAILVIQAQNWRGQGPTGSPQPPIRHEWPLNRPGSRPGPAHSPQMAAKPPRTAAILVIQAQSWRRSPGRGAG